MASSYVIEIAFVIYFASILIYISENLLRESSSVCRRIARRVIAWLRSQSTACNIVFKTKACPVSSINAPLKKRNSRVQHCNRFLALVPLSSFVSDNVCREAAMLAKVKRTAGLALGLIRPPSLTKTLQRHC